MLPLQTIGNTANHSHSSFVLQGSSAGASTSAAAAATASSSSSAPSSSKKSSKKAAKSAKKQARVPDLLRTVNLQDRAQIWAALVFRLAQHHPALASALLLDPENLLDWLEVRSVRYSSVWGIYGLECNYLTAGLAAPQPWCLDA
jgi:hypothetical protein